MAADVGADARPAHGAYGLRLAGAGHGAGALLENVPDSWPEWRVTYEPTTGPRVGDWSDEVGEDVARVALGAGTARLDRRSAATVLELPSELTEHELAHPYLSATGAVAAWWRGDLPLHAGAFVVGGRVWCLLGDREAGKSTTVAAMWRAGLPVMTDDLLVLRGRTALAGPRILDLREATASWMGAGTALGQVGLRPRWRVQLPEIAAELPFGGFVSLGWGDALSLTRLPASEQPRAVLAALAVLKTPPDPTAMLPLFTLPAWRLIRPRRLEILDEMTDLLLATLDR